ncbi:MAG: 50S ribosomal protein L13 [bacterium]|nr:50S ribosomal protein L13 [bacterium]
MTSEKEAYTIDAKGKRIGRVASQAAHALLGKHRTDFVKHKTAPVLVVVENANHMSITEAKTTGKVYTRYSGHPGGLKKTTLEEVMAKKGSGEVIRKAVYNMLPANRLRKARMKNLVVKE